MEGIQGAVLEVKLRHLDDWNAARMKFAARYHELLSGVTGIQLPAAPEYGRHVWHLFVVLVRGMDRDVLQKQLADRGVSTGVHYPTPVPLQPAYAHLGHKPGDFPVAEDVMGHCLSLPMCAEMTDEQVHWIVAAIKDVFATK
jgi:dTDP-4-amino-4,6-dideoxygalactose transaminase